MHPRPALPDLASTDVANAEVRESRAHVWLGRPDAEDDVVAEVDVNEASATCGAVIRHLAPESAVLLTATRAGFMPPSGDAWQTESQDRVVFTDPGVHPVHETLVVGEWGPASEVAAGLRANALLESAYGQRLRMHDITSGRLVQMVDIGKGHQPIVSVCAARHPRRAFGFAAAMTSSVDLSGSVWLWHRSSDGQSGCVWAVRKVVGIAAEPVVGATLPPAFEPYGAVPPLVTHAALSPDDRMLYVCCWGTGELRQYDVCDPFHPVLTGVVRLGGIGRHRPHPRHPRRAVSGGPCRVCVSRDGRRLYVTSALRAPWDAQCHPGGTGGWMVKCHADPNGGLALDPCFLVDFDGRHPHRVVLDGNEAQRS